MSPPYVSNTVIAEEGEVKVWPTLCESETYNVQLGTLVIDAFKKKACGVDCPGQRGREVKGEKKAVNTHYWGTLF